MIQDWRDSGLEGFRTAGMQERGIQERRNAGKEECMKRRMQERRDTGKDGCMTGGMKEHDGCRTLRTRVMQDKRDAGQEGYRTGGMQERRDEGMEQ